MSLSITVPVSISSAFRGHPINVTVIDDRIRSSAPHGTFAGDGAYLSVADTPGGLLKDQIQVSNRLGN